MIKAKIKNTEIKNTEIRLLKNGEFRCKDPVLLKFVQMVAEDFYGAAGCAYYPDPQHAKMQFVVKALGGKITHYDEIDYSKYPDDVCFSLQ
jgi:hypothetical protein